MLEKDLPNYRATLHEISNQLTNLQIQLDQHLLLYSSVALKDLGTKLKLINCSHDHQALVEKLLTTTTVPNLLTLNQYLEELDDELRKITGNGKKQNECISIIQETILFLQTFQEQFQPPSLSPVVHISNLQSIDRDKAYRYLIEPLSNQKRLHILLEVYAGKQRFKDLEEAVNLSGGHLLYHLNPLKESGFVVQDKQKNYNLGPKGIYFLRQLSILYNYFP